MKILIVLLIIIIVIQIIEGLSKSDKQKEKANLPIAGAYQKKWMFSQNEKGAYRKLEEICNKNNLKLFSKVRLLDLVEPVKGNSRYKTYFWKVQAKHVDFVVCDEKLVACCIIELDDSSHNQQNRKNRDAFVDEVLHSVGYEVYHVRAVIPEEIESKILTSCKMA